MREQLLDCWPIHVDLERGDVRFGTLDERHLWKKARYKLVFVDRLLAALVHLRHGVTHDVLACWFGVDR
ncbi:transposase family protein, partial [Streptomyces sp. NPDC015127]|uniref:transposase family protein n=1 Tax=Streptomyces sp. NPDC015127 TaxID=3364939 RepID=UPI0036FD852D